MLFRSSIQRQILELLQKLQKKHALCYVLITHDLAVVRAMAHEVLVLSQGDVVEQGPMEQVLNAPQAPYTKTLVFS